MFENEGQSCLMEAVLWRQQIYAETYEFIEYLLKNGADVNWTSPSDVNNSLLIKTCCKFA